MYTQEHKDGVLQEHESIINANQNLLTAIDEELLKTSLSNYERAKIELEKIQLSIGLRHKKKAYEDVKLHFESWNKEHERAMVTINEKWSDVVYRASRINSAKSQAILKKLESEKEKIKADSLLKRRYYEDLLKLL